MTCRHERRREIHIRNYYEHWIDTYCKDCGEPLIEHRGVWITRRLPPHHELVTRYRDTLIDQAERVGAERTPPVAPREPHAPIDPPPTGLVP
jgi:hypothetical protein